MELKPYYLEEGNPVFFLKEEKDLYVIGQSKEDIYNEKILNHIEEILKEFDDIVNILYYILDNIACIIDEEDLELLEEGDFY